MHMTYQDYEPREYKQPKHTHTQIYITRNEIEAVIESPNKESRAGQFHCQILPDL
jgi:hypothetical protein